jgi:hypothetical protein
MRYMWIITILQSTGVSQKFSANELLYSEKVKRVWLDPSSLSKEKNKTDLITVTVRTAVERIPYKAGIERR